MRPHYLIVLLVFCLTAPPVCVARQPEQAVNWAQMREAVASQKLTKRDVRVWFSMGDNLTSTLLRVDEDAVVVVANGKTKKRWKTSGSNEALIPRAEVTALEFLGKKGKKGLIGGLIGLGAGLGLAAVALANSESEGVMALAGVLLIPAGAIGGYLIGHAANEPLPHFRIVP